MPPILLPSTQVQLCDPEANRSVLRSFARFKCLPQAPNTSKCARTIDVQVRPIRGEHPAFDTAIMPAGTPTAYFELKRFSLIRACFNARLNVYYPLSRVFCLLPLSGAHRRLDGGGAHCLHQPARSSVLMAVYGVPSETSK
jgi:hypothetical protein